MKQVTFKSLAEFKRLAVRGAYIKGGYYDRPYRDAWREITGVQTNGVKLRTPETASGRFFAFPKARDCEIAQEESGSILKIFEDWVTVQHNGGEKQDYPDESTWLAGAIKRGGLDVVKRYKKQVAEYQLGVEE